MAIASLRIEDFRNLTKVELAPCQNGMNVICGKNGSGKTSLLEAIHYLGVGRSFRSSVSNRLIRYETNKFSIFSQLVNSIERVISAGIERDISGSTRLRIDKKDVSSVAELAFFLPIRVINSHSHNLFESGPIFRRKYLDWGLFYHSEAFLPIWQHFERALKQRNIVLRDKRPKNELDVWTQEMLKYANEMDKLRCEYIDQLFPFIQKLTNSLLKQVNLQIKYQRGWDKKLELAQVLSSNHLEEYRAGYSLFGPHRADLDVSIDGVQIKHILSRGQQKLLICAMILAQGMLLKQADKRLIYLVDDLPSELDVESREKLVSSLVEQESQVFVTAIEQEAICNLISSHSDISMKVFHVEHGNVLEWSESL